MEPLDRRQPDGSGHDELGALGLLACIERNPPSHVRLANPALVLVLLRFACRGQGANRVVGAGHTGFWAV